MRKLIFGFLFIFFGIVVIIFVVLVNFFCFNNVFIIILLVWILFWWNCLIVKFCIFRVLLIVLLINWILLYLYLIVGVGVFGNFEFISNWWLLKLMGLILKNNIIFEILYFNVNNVNFFF